MKIKKIGYLDTNVNGGKKLKETRNKHIAINHQLFSHIQMFVHFSISMTKFIFSSQCRVLYVCGASNCSTAILFDGKPLSFFGLVALYQESYFEILALTWHISNVCLF